MNRAALALVLAGCLPPKLQYVDFPLPPEQAKPALEHDAESAGITVTPAVCPDVACDPATWQLRRGPHWALLYLARHGDGSRVRILDYDLTAPDNSPIVLPPSLAAQPIHELRPDPREDGWSDVVAADFELSAGVKSDPRVGLDWRVNVAGQLGVHLVRWGELGDTPSASYSVSILAGPGITFSSTGLALMPELTLSFDRQPMVEPFAGMLVPAGPRDALDLTVAGIFFDDEHDLPTGAATYRHGLELGLTLRRPGLGGISARVGELWGPNGGHTALLALRPLKPYHALYAAIGVLLLGIIYEVARHPPSAGPPSNG